MYLNERKSDSDFINVAYSILSPFIEQVASHNQLFRSLVELEFFKVIYVYH